MGSDISLVDVDFDISEYANLALQIGLWDGRLVHWIEADDYRYEIEQRIMKLLFSEQGILFERLAAQLAWIGTASEKRSLLEREIRLLGIFDDNVIIPAGLVNFCSNLWENHKTEIIIGIAALAVAGVALGIILYSAGTAATATAIASGAALDSLNCENELKTPIVYHSNVLEVKDLLPDGIIFGANGAFVNQEYYSYLNIIQDLSLQSNASDFLKKMQETGIFEQPHITSQNLRETLLTGREIEIGKPYNNYASSAFPGGFTSSFESKPPFQEICLIGYPDQRTVHYHCGINNSFKDITEGGSCLYETLRDEFAIQPHWIHGHKIAHGLLMVHLERLQKKEFDLGTALLPGMAIVKAIDKAILNSSQIQESINYEAENLAKIADQIIEVRKPNLKQAHVTFSNGGYVFNEALKKLTPEQRNTVVVITTGTTKTIDDSLACKAYNIIGSKDWPSLLLNGGEEKLLAEKIAEIMPQTETQQIVGGHYFMQPDYQAEIREIIMKVAQEYEIY